MCRSEAVSPDRALFEGRESASTFMQNGTRPEIIRFCQIDVAPEAMNMDISEGVKLFPWF
jgi:hypothetical protein